MYRYCWMIGAVLFATSLAAAEESCSAKGQKISAEQRNHFLISCLAQASSPAHVQAVTAQEKRAQCEQNAKNMKLENARKSAYLNTCMNKNEAVAEANRINAKATTDNSKKPLTVAVKTRAHSHPSPASHTSPQTCVQQAQQKKLSSAAGKKFIATCRKN